MSQTDDDVEPPPLRFWFSSDVGNSRPFYSSLADLRNRIPTDYPISEDDEPPPPRFWFSRNVGTSLPIYSFPEDVRNRLLAAYPISESDDDVQVNLRSISYETCGKKYETCSVCIEDYTNKDIVSVLDCGHIYHANCIKEWGDNYNPSCPLCKTVIPTTPRH
jgi:hypothetical protein